MKKVILPLIALAAVYFGVNAFITELNKPATGVVMTPAEPVMLTPSITITGTTVPTETEVVTTTVVVDEPIIHPVDPEVDFMPLPFTGKKIKKWAAKFGGKVMTMNNTLATQLVRGFKLDVKLLPSKVVKVNGDLYLKLKNGDLIVIHKGDVITIDGIDDEQGITAAQLAEALQPMIGRNYGGVQYTSIYAAGNTLYLDVNLIGNFNSPQQADLQIFKNIMMSTFQNQGTGNLFYSNNISLNLSLSTNGSFVGSVDIFAFEFNPYLN